MSSTQIDTAIDRIKREQNQLQEERRLLEAERDRRMSAMRPKRLEGEGW
jgi:hypothetical protein